MKRIKPNGQIEWLRDEVSDAPAKRTKRKSKSRTRNAKGSGDNPDLAGRGADKRSGVADTVTDE